MAEAAKRAWQAGVAMALNDYRVTATSIIVRPAPAAAASVSSTMPKYTIIQRKLKAKRFFIHVSRFAELCDYRKSRVDQTILGGNNRSRGILNHTPLKATRQGKCGMANEGHLQSRLFTTPECAAIGMLKKSKLVSE